MRVEARQLRIRPLGPHTEAGIEIHFASQGTRQARDDVGPILRIVRFEQTIWAEDVQIGGEHALSNLL